MLGLIIANETQDYKSRNDLATVQETREIIKTHQFLDKQPDDFDIMAWRNSADRTNTEIATSDKWIKAQSFDGGNSDNPLAMAEVHALIRAGKYEEADDLAEKYTIDLQIKKSSLQSLRTTTIPLYQSHKDKPIFNHPRYVEVMTAIRSSIQQTQKGGDKLQGVKAQQWIEETMLEWYDENYKNYIGKNAEFKKLFLKEFNENLLIIQSTRTGDGDGLLFTAFNYTSESSKMSIDTTFQKLDNEKAKLK